MLKLFFVIFANFHRAPYIVPKMRYMADHSAEIFRSGEI